MQKWAYQTTETGLETTEPTELEGLSSFTGSLDRSQQVPIFSESRIRKVVANLDFEPVQSRINLAKTHFVRHEVDQLNPIDPRSYEYLKSPIDRKLKTKRYLQVLPDD